jgi:hypothetical protein
MLFLMTTLLPYMAAKIKRDGTSALCFGHPPDDDDDSGYDNVDQLPPSSSQPSPSLLKSRRKKLCAIILRLDKLSNILSFLNFVSFLTTSKYPTLAQRLLSTPYIRDGDSRISTTSGLERPINFSFLERRMMWDGVLRLLGAVSPLSESYRGVEFIGERERELYLCLLIAASSHTQSLTHCSTLALLSSLIRNHKQRHNVRLQVE